MKPFLRIILILVQCSGACCAYSQSPNLTSADVELVRQKLQSFDKDELTYEAVTEVGGEEWGRKLVAYYLSHTNEVTAKMKLPISRCCAFFGMHSEAVQLSRDYINVYSNDWRGWNILGGVKLQMKSYDEAVAALTNVVRLGSETNILALGGAALSAERLDVFENIVLQRLLLKKDAKETTKAKKLKMVTILVLYSLKAEKKDVFFKVLEGLDAADIRSEDTLKCYVEAGCELFKSKETERLCSQLAEPNKDKPR